jgi:uncharacterized protein YaaW (UPF0174 family)
VHTNQPPPNTNTSHKLPEQNKVSSQIISLLSHDKQLLARAAVHQTPQLLVRNTNTSDCTVLLVEATLMQLQTNPVPPMLLKAVRELLQQHQRRA